ncbi:uncharacterized protein ARMOST_05759 [Armillaria ostoyae]|uniref:Uncharacterized protein n=1 Tax=Armillaria ostoyae TaxID=47428 RepID=A0A284R158_ARMOS|nr:uncharacterized protein ARMOST_05759 [Armillaria ostoyae]
MEQDIIQTSEIKMLVRSARWIRMMFRELRESGLSLLFDTLYQWAPMKGSAISISPGCVAIEPDLDKAAVSPFSGDFIVSLSCSLWLFL